MAYRIWCNLIYLISQNPPSNNQGCIALTLTHYQFDVESVPSRDNVADYRLQKLNALKINTEPELASYLYLNYFEKCNEQSRILNFKAIQKETGKFSLLKNL